MHALHVFYVCIVCVLLGGVYASCAAEYVACMCYVPSVVWRLSAYMYGVQAV